MTCLFLDTSALVKLYVDEPGSERLAARVAGGGDVAVSALAFPEMLATIARLRREGRLSIGDHATLQARFHADWSALVVVDLDGRVLELVDRLVVDHPLRSADAVHLASALLLQESGLAVTFASADRTQNGAALAERIPVLDVRSGPG